MFVTENFWSQSDSLRNLSGVIWTILAYLRTRIIVCWSQAFEIDNHKSGWDTQTNFHKNTVVAVKNKSPLLIKIYS